MEKLKQDEEKSKVVIIKSLMEYAKQDSIRFIRDFFRFVKEDPDKLFLFSEDFENFLREEDPADYYSLFRRFQEDKIKSKEAEKIAKSKISSLLPHKKVSEEESKKFANLMPGVEDLISWYEEHLPSVDWDLTDKSSFEFVSWIAKNYKHFFIIKVTEWLKDRLKRSLEKSELFELFKEFFEWLEEKNERKEEIREEENKELPKEEDKLLRPKFKINLDFGIRK
jgi:hypothetical protein